ncbi:hypothetical protein [Streptomyces violascens]|uniref:hypothetical protein n=1 Tax=Streptomyces violascens TaxID=67381 RepID=UPI0036B30F80
MLSMKSDGTVTGKPYSLNDPEGSLIAEDHAYIYNHDRSLRLWVQNGTLVGLPPSQWDGSQAFSSSSYQFGDGGRFYNICTSEGSPLLLAMNDDYGFYVHPGSPPSRAGDDRLQISHNNQYTIIQGIY